MAGTNIIHVITMVAYLSILAVDSNALYMSANGYPANANTYRLIMMKVMVENMPLL